MGKTTTFLKESIAELKRVSWPGRDDVWATTTAVLVITAIFSAFIYVSDKLLSTVVEYVYRVIGG
jgi:preprotein translocase subunit SecE